eukprot:24625-Pelagococcus_subviridis.AAC.1
MNVAISRSDATTAATSDGGASRTRATSSRARASPRSARGMPAGGRRRRATSDTPRGSLAARATSRLRGERFVSTALIASRRVLTMRCASRPSSTLTGSSLVFARH